jgi:hexokinase
MEEGLKGHKSSLQMIPARHASMPTGSEQGRYCFLDVGGSTLKIGRVNLSGNGKYVLTGAMREAEFTDIQKNGVASDLFDYIAENIADYLEENSIDEKDVIFGFTWSFPFDQIDVDSGIHRAWAKKWHTKGVIGKDIVKLLRKAIAKNKRLKSKNIIMPVICHDAMATFVAGRYIEPDCGESVILGTGTNASYMELTDNIQKLKNKPSVAEICMDQEWGGFDKILLTKWDELLDGTSGNKGRQILEKTVSGIYLGEISRLIFKDLIAEKILFDGKSFMAFDEKYHEKNNPLGFQTSYMSRIIADISEDLRDVNVLLVELGVADSTIKDRQLLKDMCMLVAKRGARIVATVMLATIIKNDPNLEKPHSVAIDGSLFEKFSFFKTCMEEALVELIGEKVSRIKMFLVKDGSGIGAAILAAVTHDKPKSFFKKRVFRSSDFAL